MSSPTPWPRAIRLALGVALTLGAGLVTAAALGAGTEAEVDAQLRWLIVGVAGVVVAAVGNAVWLTVGMARITRRRRLLLTALGGLVPVDVTLSTGEPADAADGLPRFVSARGMSWYHDPNCLLVAGKHPRSATPARHEAAGREPCMVCAPEAGSERSRR